MRKIPREMLWVDKREMKEFQKDPLNQKIFEVYLNIRRNSPLQDFHTLQLFNEVYYLCSRVVYENEPEPYLDDYIQEIKRDLGWDYSTSTVLSMIYCVLSLRQGNSIEVNNFLKKIENHYRFETYKTPFNLFVEEEKRKNLSYNIEIGTILLSVENNIYNTNQEYNNLTINLQINNNFLGDIKKLNVAHSDVTVGVAEDGSTIYHH